MTKPPYQNGSLVIDGKVFFVRVKRIDLDQAIDALQADPDAPWEIPVNVVRLSARLREGDT